jgi:hypothetical protein
MTGLSINPADVTSIGSSFGSLTRLRWASSVALNDVRVSASSKEVNLAVKLTEGSTVSYGLVVLASGDESSRCAVWPAGIYLPALFWRTDGDLFVVGTKEEKGKEREVIFRASENSLPPSRPRLPANVANVLGVSDDSLVRFMGDVMQKRPPKLVADELGTKGKRRAVTLPAAPYPWAALLDTNSDVHIIAFTESKGRHLIFDHNGAQVETHDFSLEGISGLGGLRPVSCARGGRGVYVTGRGNGLGILHIQPNSSPKYREAFKLPIADATIYMVLPARVDAEHALVHFTWGSESNDTTGSGWLLVRAGIAKRWWVSDASGYRDQDGTVHSIAEGKTTLRGIDVTREGTTIAIFSVDSGPEELYVARIST